MKLKRSKKSESKNLVTKEIPASSIALPKVDTIIKALTGLESDIDSLHQKVGDMKKQLNQKVLSEIDKLREKVIQMATKEAETINAEAREKARAEGQRIRTAGDVNLKDVQNKIDAKFNAVDQVVSIVLKA